ncbi:hypothetical protein ACSAZL_00895 [Methanosarcina sp. T3]
MSEGTAAPEKALVSEKAVRSRKYTVSKEMQGLKNQEKTRSRRVI